MPVVAPIAGFAFGLYWVYRGRRNQSLETKEAIAKKRKIDFQDFITYEEQLENKINSIEAKIIELSKENIDDNIKENLIASRLEEIKRLRTQIKQLSEKFYYSINFSNETNENLNTLPGENTNQ